MKCPHCKKELSVPNRAWHNADTYSQRCRVTTECCGNLVIITHVRSYTVAPEQGTEDDWGVPVGEASREVYARL